MKINSHLKSGDKIGNYYIIRPLGTGGAGTVYLAEGMYGSVAIKVFHHWTPELEQEFLREGQTASKINHPNVVSCLDAQVDPETKRCYLVMEYVDAGTAMSLLNRGKNWIGNGPVISLSPPHKPSKPQLNIKSFTGISNRKISCF